MKIKIKMIDGGKKPEYKTAGAACADCYSRLITPFITIPKNSRVKIRLGFCLELPWNYEAVIRPRSGNSLKGIDIAEGIIDADYRGEVSAILINNTNGDIDIHNLERICQMKIQMAEKFEFEEVSELSKTERGAGGFGSTGVS